MFRCTFWSSSASLFSGPMRICLLLALAASALGAAVIRGTVVESQTGRPLARAVVTVEPATGAAEPVSSVRTNLYGTFEFSKLSEGSYVITASRRGFAPVQYGQKHWKAAGLPVAVEPGGTVTVSLRLPRFGAIVGTILDENDVGLPEHDVVAYRATRPPQLAARSRTDDRGRYRIFGLEPGKYFVRTVARQYEEGGYLPTFHRETQRIDEALAVDVDFDQDTPDINIHPAPGRLVNLSGQISPPTSVNVTLVSDTGTETTLSDNSGNFQFNPTAAGQYELYAQAPADPRTGAIQAAYQPLFLDRDRGDIRLPLRPLPQVTFSLKDNRGQPVDYRAVRLLARRKDLAGIGKAQLLQLPGTNLQFLPGRWELALAPMPGYYVVGFSNPRSPSTETGRADGWNEILLSGPEIVQVVLSAAPGAVHGTVMGPRHEPAAGAPVYLEAYDPGARRRLKDVQVTRADAHGTYQFTDLAPGNYRLLSSFDFEAPDAPMESSGTKALKVEEARDSTQDLDLSAIR